MYYHGVSFDIWKCYKCPMSKLYPILDYKIDVLNKSIKLLILKLYFSFSEESLMVSRVYFIFLRIKMQHFSIIYKNNSDT